MENILSNRLFEFSVQVIEISQKMGQSLEARTIRAQLIRSSTSVGANYEEAQAGSSKADFTNKVFIALKEVRESNYWLRLAFRIPACQKAGQDELGKLIQESDELKKILGAIANTARRNQ